MATTMLRPRCSVRRLRSNKITDEQLTRLKIARFAAVPKDTLSVRSLLARSAAAAKLIK
jgi:hypothetical protein